MKRYLRKERTATIKNIVFDMGNVLLDFDPQVPLDAFCGSEAEKELIRAELFNGPEWVQGDLGLIRDTDRFGLVKQRVPREHWDALKNCCDRWDICMKPIEGALPFCRHVKELGYRLFVLSNASDAFYRYFPQEVPVEYFDGIVVSADLHIIKPDRKIYEYLLEKYQLIAAECLFIDDRLENVKGARAVGMQAHQFQNDYDRIVELFQL